MGKKAYNATDPIKSKPWRDGGYSLGVNKEGDVQTIMLDDDQRIFVAQPDLYVLLGDMVQELKKINLQLALITDIEIGEVD